MKSYDVTEWGRPLQARLRGLGHERVIACDIDDGKLAVARERGAKATCNLESEGLKRLGELAPGGIYGMLDFVGMREIAILGSAVGTTQEIKELVDLVKQGRVQLPEVERRPLAMAEQSLADLAAGKVRGRVVLEMQGEG